VKWGARGHRWVMTDGGWWIGRLRGFYSLAEGRGDAGLGQIC
jgi:hypothetical protein